MAQDEFLRRARLDVLKVASGGIISGPRPFSPAGYSRVQSASAAVAGPIPAERLLLRGMRCPAGEPDNLERRAHAAIGVAMAPPW